MARMPGAQWRPLAASTTRISSYDIVCIHTMVGSLTGTDGYFRSIAPGVNSHFGTGGDGTIYQWVDTAYRSGANLNGNHHIISIENADMGPGFAPWNTNDGGAVPPFTAAQIEANARILAWANQAHGIPLTLIPDSKPGRRGIGYHRQGVPGYMVSGGERWSNATGKVCPGHRRIAQIPQIIERARQIAAGTTPPPPEDDMAAVPQTEWNAVKKQLADLHAAFLTTRHEVPEFGDPEDPNDGWQAVTYLRSAERHLRNIRLRDIALVREEIAAVRAAVDELADRIVDADPPSTSG